MNPYIPGSTLYQWWEFSKALHDFKMAFFEALGVPRVAAWLTEHLPR